MPNAPGMRKRVRVVVMASVARWRCCAPVACAAGALGYGNNEQNVPPPQLGTRSSERTRAELVCSVTYVCPERRLFTGTGAGTRGRRGGQSSAKMAARKEGMSSHGHTIYNRGLPVSAGAGWKYSVRCGGVWWSCLQTQCSHVLSECLHRSCLSLHCPPLPREEVGVVGACFSAGRGREKPIPCTPSGTKFQTAADSAEDARIHAASKKKQ